MIFMALNSNSPSTILNPDSIVTAMYDKVDCWRTDSDSTLDGSDFVFVESDFV